MDEETRNEGSKRQRQSEDEDDDLEIMPSSPLIPDKSQTSVNVPAKPSTTQRTYGKPQYNNSSTSHNRLVSQNATPNKYTKILSPAPKPLQNNPQVPRSAENSFFQQVHKHDIPSKPRPPTTNSQPPIKKQNPRPQHHQRSPGQLPTTDINPYIVDEEEEPLSVVL